MKIITLAADASEEEGNGAAGEPAAIFSKISRLLQVQVKRKETEKQQENRLRSYGYLKEVEEKEAWRELKLHSAASTAAHNLRAKLLHPQDRCLPMDLPPDAYLASLVPGRCDSAMPSLNRH